MRSPDDPSLKPQPLAYAQGNFPPRRRRDARHYFALIFSGPFLLIGIGIGAIDADGVYDLFSGHAQHMDTAELWRTSACAVIATVSGIVLLVFGFRGDRGDGI